jgi:hypothetical protein
MIVNTIPTSWFFATPNTVQELMDYIENFNGSERVIATTVALMALNLAHKLMNEQIKEAV